jgi:hypothetical protein
LAAKNVAHRSCGNFSFIFEAYREYIASAAALQHYVKFMLQSGIAPLNVEIGNQALPTLSR